LCVKRRSFSQQRFALHRIKIESLDPLEVSIESGVVLQSFCANFMSFCALLE